MARIVNITDTEVSIGLDDGRLQTVAKSALSFYPQIGDTVELFQSDTQIVVNKVAAAQNQAFTPSQGVAQNPNAKSKLAAGLLQIFLGSLGVGRFYLGFTGLGVAQLLVSIFTCGIGAIWPFIDGILILTSKAGTDYHKDADGNELAD